MMSTCQCGYFYVRSRYSPNDSQPRVVEVTESGVTVGRWTFTHDDFFAVNDVIGPVEPERTIVWEVVSFKRPDNPTEFTSREHAIKFAEATGVSGIDVAIRLAVR